MCLLKALKTICAAPAEVFIRTCRLVTFQMTDRALSMLDVSDVAVKTVDALTRHLLIALLPVVNGLVPAAMLGALHRVVLKTTMELSSAAF
jgi:hypothetical protein